MYFKLLTQQNKCIDQSSMPLFKQGKHVFFHQKHFRKVNLKYCAIFKYQNWDIWKVEMLAKLTTVTKFNVN